MSRTTHLTPADASFAHAAGWVDQHDPREPW